MGVSEGSHLDCNVVVRNVRNQETLCSLKYEFSQLHISENIHKDLFRGFCIDFQYIFPLWTIASVTFGRLGYLDFGLWFDPVC